MNNSINPILAALNQTNASLTPQTRNLAQIKNMMNTLKFANNPQAMLQQMIQNNPQMQQVIDYINNNGGNPKEAFYKMAQEKGINPEDVLKMLQ